MVDKFRCHFDIVVLIGSLIIASILRIVVPFSMVFQNGKVIFSSVDAYGQLRFADLISAHPYRVSFYDPYLSGYLGSTPLFNLLLAWIGRIFGNINIVSAYLPAILGILTLIPVFVIARTIFNNKWVTSLSVLFIAILPGLFFNRTQLGAADYHCLEILLLTTMTMWIILAFKEDWLRLKLCYIGIAICTFCFYFWTWKGCFVVLGILAVFLYVWVGLLWAKKRSIRHTIIFHSSLFAILFSTIVLLYSSNYGVLTSWVHYGMDILRWNPNLVSAEEMPLLFFGQASGSSNMVDLQVVWGYFGFLFFFALVGLGMLIYRVQKHRQPIEILLLVWAVVILMLMLAMRRWAYYFAVNVAILSAYSCYVIGKALIIKKAVIKI